MKDHANSIFALQARVAVLESKLWTLQNEHRMLHRALCLAHQAIQDGLTQPAYKLPPELQKEWDRITQHTMNEQKRRGQSMQTKRLEQWEKILPH